MGLLLLFLMCNNEFYRILKDMFLIFIYCPTGELTTGSKKNDS
jgi:hypothetical protein